MIKQRILDMRLLFLFTLSVSALHLIEAYVHTPANSQRQSSVRRRKKSRSKASTALFQQKIDKNDPFSNQERLNTLQQQARIQSLVRAALSIGLSDNLVVLRLAGTTMLPGSNNGGQRLCLVLELEQSRGDGTGPQPCLIVPLLSDSHWKPIESHFSNMTLSSSLLLRLNSIVVNRDGGLWDNLPWPLWTIDPARRNYDAAGMPLDPKFHMGKRDAYNVMLGKDWFTFKSSSQAVALIAEQLRTTTTTNDPQNDQQSQNEKRNKLVLARRLLEMQIRELEMDIAELDYQMAINVGNQNVDTTLEFLKEELVVGLDLMKEQIQELMIEDQSLGKTSFSSPGLIQRILDSVNNGTAAPYRGATGYAPYQSTRDSGVTIPVPKQFTSPYAMLVEIIENQLRADVVGCVLENTSLLEGTKALGGAIVLQRKTSKKDVSISGVKFSVEDEEENYGNEGIRGGEILVVECEADEALGLSLACGNIPLQTDETLWRQCSILAQPESSLQSGKLRTWKALDPELSILLEGQAANQSTTSRIAPIRIPRTSMSLYDTLFLQSRSSLKGEEVFPTDNPIRTLAEFDSLSDPEKARTILSLSNFRGRLPRPRVVREAQTSTRRRGSEFDNPLDELLIPLLDESVRRQYRIRQAERQGNTELARELEESKSNRQKALEAAEKARALGQDDDAQRWEEKADLYGSLRADVTQDEGSYSRFLDRDEWYERERRKHASKIDKKKFGRLLDGIE